MNNMSVFGEFVGPSTHQARIFFLAVFFGSTGLQSNAAREVIDIRHDGAFDVHEARRDVVEAK
jgi:hypothetical protein